MRRLARYNKKAPTGTKLPYLFFNPHTGPPLLSSEAFNPEVHILTGVFIDPGIKNCAIRVATLDLTTGRVQTNLQIKCNFCHDSISEGKTQLDTVYYMNVFTVLEPYQLLFQWSHYIVIESQPPMNYELVRMGQHLITYLSLVVRNSGFRPLIIEIDSHLKSRMLGAPLKMTRRQLKKWGTAKAIEILRARGDDGVAQMLAGSGKNDDHGDTVCYDEIWWRILFQGLHAIPKPVAPARVSRLCFQ